MSNPVKSHRYAVLVVEDDPLLLVEAMDLAEDAGFLVYGARDAARALEHLERHPEIRVLFTDVVMPGSMDGLKLARAVRDRWPPVAIIVTSGKIDVSQRDMPENGVFFTKPYPPAKIIQALNDIAGRIAA